MDEDGYLDMLSNSGNICIERDGVYFNIFTGKDVGTEDAVITLDNICYTKDLSIVLGRFGDKPIEYINSCVTCIGESSFKSNWVTECIILADSIESIGDHAYDDSKALISIQLSKNLKTLGNSAFKDCINLKEIVVPDGAISIGDDAFCGCKNLERVIFPKSVTTIGVGAFNGVDKLKEMVLPKKFMQRYGNIRCDMLYFV